MVNIFLPYPNIYYSAKCLDKQRLGKQRVEAKQLIDLLEEYDKTGIIPSKGWSTHPAFRSWIGFTNHLKVYFNIIVREWISRGCQNNMPLYHIDETLYHIVECTFDGVKAVYDRDKFNEYSFPYWVSFPPFYLSHQAALLRKNPKYYRPFYNNTLIPFINNGYLWPCNITSIDNWNFSMHDSLSSGCPPIFRLKIKDIITWIYNNNINPTTGRNIGSTSNIYKEYLECVNELGIQISGEYIFIKYYFTSPVHLSCVNSTIDMLPSQLILNLM